MRNQSTLLIAAVMLFAACSPDSVRISGRFGGYPEQQVYLYRLLPGSQVVEDSTVTDERGEFRFDVKLPGGEATVYNLRHKNEVIPLLLSPGEKVSVNSLGKLSLNYTVTGSEGSDKMREMRGLLMEGAARLDSILGVYARSDEGVRRQIAMEYTAEYYKTKQDHIRFIVANPGSLVAVYALYQRLPNDTYLFNGQDDILYYRLVADSVAVRYPQSPYLKALLKEIGEAESTLSVTNMLAEQIESGGAQYPDIELPDMYGAKHRLSELDGNVVLLDFWASSSRQGKFNNAELKKIYQQAEPLGFRVYQVSVDTEKALWVRSVQEQKLPWITLCDFNGANSVPVMTYNVSAVPSNMLLDREGNIVARDIYGDELRKKVDQLLK